MSVLGRELCLSAHLECSSLHILIPSAYPPALTTREQANPTQRIKSNTNPLHPQCNQQMDPPTQRAFLKAFLPALERFEAELGGGGGGGISQNHTPGQGQTQTQMVGVGGGGGGGARDGSESGEGE